MNVWVLKGYIFSAYSNRLRASLYYLEKVALIAFSIVKLYLFDSEVRLLFIFPNY